ncbi:Germin-like protein subfamily 1 member 18 [Hibiscus syriacus]|uniref:Germin-like protein subfamily 1 member 18 n=1 Tax=Hibiscus syriacus TaxID=106335 RepID=A0A6A2XXC7_HIBSY|nr:Germin-like protein subfamily 1 member 18 [Hibiscus syriacus]
MNNLPTPSNEENVQLSTSSYDNDDDDDDDDNDGGCDDHGGDNEGTYQPEYGHIYSIAFHGDQVFVNGKFCKDPKLAVADDFFFSGLNMPGNTSNLVGSNVTTVNVDQIPGLNTLGISLVRIHYAPYGGRDPPHTPPLPLPV